MFVSCDVEEAVAQARRFQIPMSLAMSKYKAVQADSAVKHPSGFFVMFQENQQPQWHWALSNEYAVGSWLIFDKDGKLQEQIKFDCPTMMTIDKKGEGDAVLRQLDCIEIDSNDVPLDDVGMTPNCEIECTPPLEIDE